jgi:hypothetical protein
LHFRRTGVIDVVIAAGAAKGETQMITNTEETETTQTTATAETPKATKKASVAKRARHAAPVKAKGQKPSRHLLLA